MNTALTEDCGNVRVEKCVFSDAEQICGQTVQMTERLKIKIEYVNTKIKKIKTTKENENDLWKLK